MKTRLNSLCDWLVNRGYKQEVIKEINQVDAIERESTSKTSKAKQNRNIDANTNNIHNTNLWPCVEKCLWGTSQSTSSYF